MSRARIIVGDCRESMAALPAESVDAVVCDPPYELGFMGKSWDASGIAYDLEVWRQALRVLKPGGYLLAFGGTRTYHRMTVAIEDAGFSIRDCIGWQYGSGFPKSLNLGGGWGTALKPAWEPIVVARAPFPGTVAGNVLKHGTGAMNIDGCRVGTEGGGTVCTNRDEAGKCRGHNNAGRSTAGETFHGPDTHGGRWPANVLLSCSPDCDDDTHAPGCPCAALDAQQEGTSRYFNRLPIEADDLVPFFYAAKASRSEREAGCDALPARTGAEAVEREEGSAGTQSPRAGAGRTAASVRNHHPTVKPAAVMAWCIRLVTPPGGLVLDPFMGSGTTGIAAVREKMRFIGCELSPEYAEIARARIRFTLGPLFAHEVT